MGSGKKTHTNTSKEKIPYSPTVNCSVSARNLRKDELGGVIFGCKDHTIKECLSNRLFGLPEPHFSYVKNIHPGMPLFLFNYSDRKLHGIYEAASYGTKSINPYGWTKNGSDLTEYPAQVRVHVKKQCQMLSEEQFKNILCKNYLKDTKHHFWFELDHAQTAQLISLFEASPLSSALSYNSPRRIRTAPILDTRQVNEYLKNSATGEGRSKYSTTASGLQIELLHPTRKWASLFKENSDPSTQREKGGMPSVSEVNSDEGQVFLSDKDSGPARITACWEKDAGKKICWGDIETESSDDADCWEDEIGPLDVTPFGDEGAGPSSSTCWEEEAGASGVTLLEDGNQIAEIHIEKETIEEEEERIYRKLEILDLERKNSNTKDAAVFACRMSNSHLEDGRSSAADSMSDKTQNPCLEDTNSSTTHSTSRNHEDVSTKLPDTSTKSPNIQSEIDQLSQEMEEIKTFTREQQERNSAMEKKLEDSCILLQRLRQRVTSLETHLRRGMSLETHLQDSSPKNVEVLGNSFRSEQLIESFDERFFGVGELIFIMGGLNGKSWLSTMDCYSPLRDIMKSVLPMSSVRSHASAVVLNGLIYNIGGTNSCSELWYDTVECYNPMSNEWVSCPSLNEKKGCLASAVLNNKIYAIGGGNGRDLFNQVEMFDPMIGRWIPIQSMLHKRFATAAAEFDGALYVAGGFDGKHYLKSVERFDPREASWSKIQSMKTRRGSHALTNFKGKLYALSGHNGKGYVPSVEIFDPLMGTWLEGDNMKYPRGYFFAPVIGDSIFAIGGLENENMVDEVEIYRPGHGWSVTHSTGFGKRCYFSAVVY